MRLDTGDNVIQNDEVVVRLLNAVNADGVSAKRSPTLIKPPKVDACGIISALNTDEWGIQTCNAPTQSLKSRLNNSQTSWFIYPY